VRAQASGKNMLGAIAIFCNTWSESVWNDCFAC